MIMTVAGIVGVVMGTAFLMSVVFQRNDVVDFFWGLGFILVAVALFVQSGTYDLLHGIPTIAVIVWGTRLCMHIFERLIGTEEDHRYHAWREEWMTISEVYFYIRSCIQIYILQGVCMIAVLFPILVLYVQPVTTSGIHFVLLGSVVWITGFCFEMIADSQLARYLSRTPRPRILRTGLWKFSRHPNYFGEVVMWWGIWFMTLGTSLSWLGVIGPLTITILILYISGIPLTEERFDHSKTYARYRAETSAFVPLRPFRSDW